MTTGGTDKVCDNLWFFTAFYGKPSATHLISMRPDFTRKVFFAPMVIASLNLVALLLFYQRAKQLPVTYTTVQHFLPSQSREHELNGWHTLETYNDKLPVIFTLDGSAADWHQLTLIRAAATKIESELARSHYLKIRLAENTRYGDIVSLIGIMKKDGHKRYMIWQDSFYVFPPSKEDLEMGSEPI
jgi:hypothetical protein